MIFGTYNYVNGKSHLPGANAGDYAGAILDRVIYTYSKSIFVCRSDNHTRLLSLKWHAVTIRFASYYSNCGGFAICVAGGKSAS